MKALGIALVIALAYSAPDVQAQDEDLSASLSDRVSQFSQAKISQPHPPALRFTVGDFHGLLEKTTLTEMHNKLGGTIERNNLDAAGGEYSLCYFLPTEGAQQEVRFYSNAEMGGPNHDVTGIRAVAVESKLPTCSVPAKRSQSFSLEHGVRIGAQVDGAVRALGRPSSKSGNSITGKGDFFYYYAKPPTADDPAFGPVFGSLKNKDEGTLVNTLQIRVRKGRITGYAVTRVTAN